MSVDTGLTIFGFVVSLFIAFWAFKRTEVSRIKDVFISKAEDLPVWLLTQLNQNDYYQIENLYAGKLTHLEMRLKQLNLYAKHKFASDVFFDDLRNVDLETLTKEDAFKVHEIVFNLIERTEEEYFKFYYSFCSRFIAPHSKKFLYVTFFFLNYSPLLFLIYFILS